jgi:hypothetical protein
MLKSHLKYCIAFYDVKMPKYFNAPYEIVNLFIVLEYDYFLKKKTKIYCYFYCVNFDPFDNC